MGGAGCRITRSDQRVRWRTGRLSRATLSAYGASWRGRKHSMRPSSRWSNAPWARWWPRAKRFARTSTRSSAPSKPPRRTLGRGDSKGARRSKDAVSLVGRARRHSQTSRAGHGDVLKRSNRRRRPAGGNLWRRAQAAVARWLSRDGYARRSMVAQMSGSAQNGFAEAIAEVARQLQAEGSAQESLQTMVELAVSTIRGCDHAGVSIVERDDEIDTPAASDDVPRHVDALQYRSNEGPCLDAIRDHAVFQTDDLRAERRWPNFSLRATRDTGVRSMLSFRLFVEQGTLGALNLYS